MYGLGLGGAGYPPLREFVARKLSRRSPGVVSADDVLITSGSSQGVDLVNRLLVSKGDTVIIEEYAWAGALNRARAAGVEIVGAPLDAGGIRMDALEAKLADLQGRGITPKYIYTVPTIQNPTGSVLSLERRLQLIDLSRRFNVPIFEDECYADLTWTMDAPPTLYALAPSQVVHIGSFSKSLSPALRVAYVVADWAILGRMLNFRTEVGALDQMIVSEFFTSHYDSHMATLTKSLQNKLTVMTEALEKEFGTSVEIWKPEGGIFVWVQFPDHIDVRSFTASGQEAGIAFNPGPEWTTSPEDGKNFMRLCFALPDEETIRNGIAELARVCFEATGLPPRSSNKSRATD